MRLLEQLKKNNTIVLDGGLATTLESYGCNLNSSLWSSEVLISEPEKVKDAHQAFTNAGADIVITSTYQASFPTFKEKGLSNVEIIHLYENAIDAIKRATSNQQTIVGSLGPYGAHLSNGSEYTGAYHLSNDEYFKFHHERIDALIYLGVHDFVFETIPSFSEIKAIVENIIPHYSSDDTFWLSITVNKDGDLSDGTPLEKVCTYIKNHTQQVPIFGVNCSSISAINYSIEKGLLNIPQTVAIYPNGGATYNPLTKKWSTNKNHEALFEIIPSWIKQGVKIIGGCCQVSPQDIKKIKSIVM